MAVRFNDEDRCIHLFKNKWGLRKFKEDLKSAGLNKRCYMKPCLPYIGKQYRRSDVRIVFVGKAPLARNRSPATDGLSFNEAIRDSFGTVDWVSEHFAGRDGYYSSFWRSIYLLTGSLQEDRKELMDYRLDEKSELKSRNCFESIAWTNIFKICMRRKESKDNNPDDRMCKFLLEHFNTLPDEIDALKPDVIIFTTGKSYDKYLDKALRGRFQIRTRELKGLPGVSRISIIGHSTLVLRTPHFQAMSRLELKHLYRYIKRNLPCC